jgi:hypothetical protein
VKKFHPGYFCNCKKIPYVKKGQRPIDLDEHIGTLHRCRVDQNSCCLSCGYFAQYIKDPPMTSTKLRGAVMCAETRLKKKIERRITKLREATAIRGDRSSRAKGYSKSATDEIKKNGSQLTELAQEDQSA